VPSNVSVQKLFDSTKNGERRKDVYSSLSHTQCLETVKMRELVQTMSSFSHSLWTLCKVTYLGPEKYSDYVTRNGIRMTDMA